ncbi:MAG TPA: ribbon-helix-helix protein, CopG family [Longimicrobium sp.]
MPVRITFELPDDMRPALDAATRAEGISESEIVMAALRKYLFKQRFRELRAMTLRHMRMSGRGDVSDEDVFRAVS